jgi:hypothetical protein
MHESGQNIELRNHANGRSGYQALETKELLPEIKATQES